MEKYYKDINGVLNYWEYWKIDRKNAIIHYGVIGEVGYREDLKEEFLENSIKDELIKRTQIQKELGFKKISEKKMQQLVIKYRIEGFGNVSDLDKRTEVSNFLQEILGWNGLGHSDDGSIGNGTMEVYCYVVNFEIAKRVIEKEFLDTPYIDYISITEEWFG